VITWEAHALTADCPWQPGFSFGPVTTAGRCARRRQPSCPCRKGVEHDRAPGGALKYCGDYRTGLTGGRVSAAGWEMCVQVLAVPARAGNSARLAIFVEPFLGTDGICRPGGCRYRFAFGLQLRGLPAVELVEGPTLHRGNEHFQCAAAGVDIVVIRNPLRTHQVVLPETAQDLTLPVRHCELNGPKRVCSSLHLTRSLSSFTARPATESGAWLLPACAGSWPNPILTGVPPFGVGYTITEAIYRILFPADQVAPSPMGESDGLFNGFFFISV
jgi:hypothetical protein